MEVSHRLAGAMLAVVLVLPAAAAQAAPEEIQVYMDEMDKRGEVGLDVHVNYTPVGRLAGADYAGEQASDQRWRITPEWSYGLTPNIELGAYLPLTTVDRNGNLEWGGVKGRIKFIAPHPDDQAWFWGLNFELGRVRRDLDINPWNAELKGIVGVRSGPWTLAGNLNIDWVVSGPQHDPTTFQVATKLSYKLSDKTSLGLESYNEIGDSQCFGRLSDRDQELFAVIDRSFGKWDLDFGVGRGYGAPEDKWVVKMIIGVPIG